MIYPYHEYWFARSDQPTNEDTILKALMALFGRSPFKPIQAHMEKSRACVERIKPVINSIIDNEPAEFDRVFKEISDLESEADVIKNDIRSHLPKSIFLPIDRRDLLEILDIQEELPDTVQDIAILLTLRPLKLPANMKEPLNNLIDEVATVCNQAADLVQEFDELVETSFGGKEAEKVLAMIEQINADETVADGTERAAAKKLFDLEKEVEVLDVIMWSRIINKLGDLADSAERMANRLRLMIAK